MVTVEPLRNSTHTHTQKKQYTMGKLRSEWGDFILTTSVNTIPTWHGKQVLLIGEVLCIGKLHEPSSSHTVASGISWRLSGTTSGIVAQSLYRKLSAGLEGSASLAAPYSDRLLLSKALDPGNGPALCRLNAG